MSPRAFPYSIASIEFSQLVGVLYSVDYASLLFIFRLVTWAIVKEFLFKFYLGGKSLTMVKVTIYIFISRYWKTKYIHTYIPRLKQNVNAMKLYNCKSKLMIINSKVPGTWIFGIIDNIVIFFNLLLDLSMVCNHMHIPVHQGISHYSHT